MSRLLRQVRVGPGGSAAEAWASRWTSCTLKEWRGAVFADLADRPWLPPAGRVSGGYLPDWSHTPIGSSRSPGCTAARRKLGSAWCGPPDAAVGRWRIPVACRHRCRGQGTE